MPGSIAHSNTTHVHKHRSQACLEFGVFHPFFKSVLGAGHNIVDARNSRRHVKLEVQESFAFNTFI